MRLTQEKKSALTSLLTAIGMTSGNTIEMVNSIDWGDDTEVGGTEIVVESNLFEIQSFVRQIEKILE